MKKIDRIGEISYNKYNNKMTIVEYKNSKNIIVEFSNKYKTHTNYIAFKKGDVRNPYDKSVYGVGFWGEDGIRLSINGVKNNSYIVWVEMLRRCYSYRFHLNNLTYVNCLVCENWHNYSNFKKWYDDNFYQLENFKMCLDKDILVKENKIYSPETCIFVPSFMNLLFVKNDKTRGEFPIGVRSYKITNKIKYRSQYIKNKELFCLGSYDTPEEAFYAYKKAKEDHIKEIADQYKNKIPEKLYNVLINYRVEITD